LLDILCKICFHYNFSWFSKPKASGVKYFDYNLLGLAILSQRLSYNCTNADCF